MAPSLHTFANSAPLNPGVRIAILLATYYIVSLGSYLTFAKWTCKIYFLSSKLGKPIYTERSNLPGLRRAGSRVSLMLVAPMTITLFYESKPSILTRSWFKVLSLS